MANRLHVFKHRDVVRIVKAARAAGVDVDQVTVDSHTGAITVGPAQRVSSTNKSDEAPPPKRRAKS